jgi:hypothetical protein
LSRLHVCCWEKGSSCWCWVLLVGTFGFYMILDPIGDLLRRAINGQFECNYCLNVISIFSWHTADYSPPWNSWNADRQTWLQWLTSARRLSITFLHSIGTSTKTDNLTYFLQVEFAPHADTRGLNVEQSIGISSSCFLEF